jgi:hypothetical protein
MTHESFDPAVIAAETEAQMVERVIFACRQSLQTRMPLHVPQERVDEVARDVGVAAFNAALEASHHAELVDLLKRAAPFVGWAAKYEPKLAGEVSDKLCDEIDTLLAKIGGEA